jgi:hypothetical protein
MSSSVKFVLAAALCCATGCDGASTTGGGDDASPDGGDGAWGAGGSSHGDGVGGGAVETGAGGGAGSPDGSGGSGEPSSAAAGGGAPADPCPSFAAEIVAVTYGPGAGFGQDEAPGIVLGAPRGGGCCQGSLDVLSLGNGGAITLGFHETVIVDGEGADLTVFENAFLAGGDPASPFVELGTVEVSADGETWHAFPCAILEAPWDACAGVTPVEANADTNDVDPLDPSVSGGDAYDLADVGLAEARFVRITDRADQSGFAGTFDLDAVAVVNGRCDAVDEGS